jgi:hypothetical protein
MVRDGPCSKATWGPNFGAVSPKSGETLCQQLEELRLEAQTMELKALQPDQSWTSGDGLGRLNL